VAEANAKAQIVASMPTTPPNGSLRARCWAGEAGLVMTGPRSRPRPPRATPAAGQLAVPERRVPPIAPRPLSYREKQILGIVVIGLHKP